MNTFNKSSRQSPNTWTWIGILELLGIFCKWKQPLMEGKYNIARVWMETFSFLNTSNMSVLYAQNYAVISWLQISAVMLPYVLSAVAKSAIN